MTKQAAEWLWKFLPFYTSLKPKQQEKIDLILRLLHQDAITPEEAVILARR